MMAITFSSGRAISERGNGKMVLLSPDILRHYPEIDQSGRDTVPPGRPNQGIGSFSIYS